ncbi:E1a [Simian adenovirus 20]|uniref:Early E1A protein n=1 Tax=Simian adenovirus 20 TaxID=585059 RepID=F6KST5_9ADEN|nr:E1a [Simian adenovirus 20]AEF59040.1 E1a [Simian adenovirus 20]
MRNFILSPGLPPTVAAELLEDIVSGALGDDPQVISHFCDDFSLHDLYDIDPGTETETDPLATAVDEFFPESMLLEADMPPHLESPVQPGAGGAMPTLSPEDVDLKCYENMPESEDEDSGICEPTRAMVSQALEVLKDQEENFVLDAPPVPGRDCKSCRYHRDRTGESTVLCSLCYLRINAAFVYSKLFFVLGPISDAEEPDSTTGSVDDKPSPPQMTEKPERPRPNILKPKPQRVSSRRRLAVDSIQDLLLDPLEPLDLSLKRPRLQ